MAHMRCPKCGFRLAVRGSLLSVDDCPRCAARGRSPAPMVLCQGLSAAGREFSGWKFPAGPASPHHVQSYVEAGE
jgi:hypothetical protein